MISKTVSFLRQYTSRLTRMLCVGTIALGMTGCDEVATFTPAFAAEADADTKVVTVGGTKVTLGRVAGYCFKDRQSKITSAGAFVVMAPCDPLADDTTAKGLILVNVLADEGITAAINDRDLEAYFQSNAGRAALSRKGNAENLTILGTMQDGGIYYVHTIDVDGPVIPDTTDDQWRVFFVASDRLVSVSVVNFIDDQMPDGLVFAHMEAIARRINSLN